MFLSRYLKCCVNALLITRCLPLLFILLLSLGLSCIVTGCNPNAIGGCAFYQQVNTTVIMSTFGMTKCKNVDEINRLCYVITVQFKDIQRDKICTKELYYNSLTDALANFQYYKVNSQKMMLWYDDSDICREPSKKLKDKWETGVTFLLCALFTFVVSCVRCSTFLYK